MVLELIWPEKELDKQNDGNDKQNEGNQLHLRHLSYDFFIHIKIAFFIKKKY